MLTTSEEFLAAILAMSRTDRLTGTLTKADGTVIELGDSNIEDGSVSVSRECVTGEEIEFGSAVMAQLDFDLRTEESRYAFYNAKISLVYGVKLADGTWFDIPMGEFTVAEAERKNTLVQLTAYDNLLDMDDDYGGKALYGTPYEIFVAICEHCGLELATTEEEFLAMPNGEEKIQVDETSGCTTWRDCAKVVAQMIGAFIVADRNGAIALKRYGKDVCMTIPKRNRIKTTMADYVCSYMGLRVTGSSGEYRAYNVDQQEGLELTIKDAPAWDYGLPETLQARADTLLTEVTQIVYTPGSITMIGNPALECGDLVELQTDDGSVTTLITEITWKYRGKMTVKSAGVNPYLKNQVTRKTVILRELQTQTTENRLIFYSFTNQNAVTVKSGGDEQLVSQVTFATTKPTSAMFIAQLPVEVACEDTVTSKTTETQTEYPVTASSEILDADGNVVTLSVLVTDKDTVKTVTHGFVDLQVEYYLDGTLVDYQLVQRCHRGKHILALFYTFDSLDGNQNFQWQVKIRVVDGSGTVTVPKRAFRATVTGQGMAGTDQWDGTLSFDESVSAISLRSKLTLVDIAEEVSTQTQIPTPANFVQTVAPISLRSSMTLVGITERISTTEIRQKKTIDYAEWQKNDRYVELTPDGIMARLEWTYQSEEAEIDQGRMTVVKAVTNDLESVEEVTVDG